MTIADRRAETALRELISARYPAHAVLGEEFGRRGPMMHATAAFLDPIDGTLSFISGVPIYGVMVAVECAGEPVAGVSPTCGSRRARCSRERRGLLLERPARQCLEYRGVSRRPRRLPRT